MRASLEYYIGQNVEHVAAALKASAAYTLVQTVEEGSMVIRNFMPNRIRVWYDSKTQLVLRLTEG